jgi:hypothetical protein
LGNQLISDIRERKNDVWFSRKLADDGVRGEKSQLNELIQVALNLADENQES